MYKFKKEESIFPLFCFFYFHSKPKSIADMSKLGRRDVFCHLSTERTRSKEKRQEQTWIGLNVSTVSDASIPDNSLFRIVFGFIHDWNHLPPHEILIGRQEQFNVLSHIANRRECTFRLKSSTHDDIKVIRSHKCLPGFYNIFQIRKYQTVYGCLYKRLFPIKGEELLLEYFRTECAVIRVVEFENGSYHILGKRTK